MEQSDSQIRQLSQGFFEDELRRYGDVVPPSGQDDETLKCLLTLLIDGRKVFDLLDIGCGIGYVARATKALYPEANVLGTDISQTIIAKARELDPEGGVHYQVANELSLPSLTERFDFAICRYSIHHYPKMRSHLREVHRILRPQGTYLVIDVLPDSGQDDDRLNEVFTNVERETTGHIKFYTLKEYEAFADDASLSVAGVERFPLVLDFPKGSPHYHALRGMPEDFRNSVSLGEEDERLQVTLKAAGVYLRRQEETT